jgi:hypothetical protein
VHSLATPWAVLIPVVLPHVHTLFAAAAAAAVDGAATTAHLAAATSAAARADGGDLEQLLAFLVEACMALSPSGEQQPRVQRVVGDGTAVEVNVETPHHYHVLFTTLFVQTLQFRFTAVDAAAVGIAPSPVAPLATQTRTGVGVYIVGVNGSDWGLVVGDEGAVWRLEAGRVAKKRTEGVKWNWRLPAAAAAAATATAQTAAAAAARADPTLRAVHLLSCWKALEMLCKPRSSTGTGWNSAAVAATADPLAPLFGTVGASGPVAYDFPDGGLIASPGFAPAVAELVHATAVAVATFGRHELVGQLQAAAVWLPAALAARVTRLFNVARPADAMRETRTFMAILADCVAVVGGGGGSGGGSVGDGVGGSAEAALMTQHFVVRAVKAFGEATTRSISKKEQLARGIRCDAGWLAPAAHLLIHTLRALPCTSARNAALAVPVYIAEVDVGEADVAEVDVGEADVGEADAGAAEDAANGGAVAAKVSP